MLFTFSRHVATVPLNACAYRTPASTTLYDGVYTVFASSIGRRPTSCQFNETNAPDSEGTRYSPSRLDFQAWMPTNCLLFASAASVFVIVGSRMVKPLYVTSRDPIRPVTIVSKP